MDSIYNEYEPQQSKYSQAQQQLVHNNAQAATGLGSTISPGNMLRGGRQISGQQQGSSQQQLPSLWSNRPTGTSPATVAAIASATTQEGMINLMRNSLVDQLHHWDEMTNRMFREKSPQDLLIEYLQKKMEQDAELNRILIASTERMAKFQADAQIQSASLLKKCASTLRNFANGQKDEDEEEDEDDDEEEEEEEDEDVLGVN
jgi:CRISPR/Cas system-associated endonuclease/helicase Cas3